MLGIDPEIASSTLRLWIAAGSTAVLVVVAVLAFSRSRKGLVGAGTCFVLVVIAALSGASMVWAALGSMAERDQGTERAAFETRADRLDAQALLPGSVLACLDPLTGETIQAACEKAVFASPATVASANSYIAARFALLSDMVAYTRRGGADIDSVLLPLRRSLEADPFGFLAHVLTIRDGCTGAKCAALELLHDPSHVRMNLIAETFDHYIDHYRDAWAKPTDAPVAEAADAPSATAQLTPPAQHKVMVNIDFPSAASIPAVSIMNPERKGPAVASAPAASPTPAAPAAQPSRRPPKHPLKPAAQDGAQSGGAQSGGAPPSTEAAQTDPVWTPAPAAAAR